ncbi:hypothetical protein RvY_16374 [Ramazzottius varieornatus]|uniref:Uncharacterized protein n=1 Tax=Ramazzottius varieornatus TaxID=947166 RepID=A0A1D1VY76_RAMVA|nr:hypothetical protein RvY_16374 [Ramazzottius varieornatus]
MFVLCENTVGFVCLVFLCGSTRANAKEGAPKILSMSVDVPDATNQPPDSARSTTVKFATDRAVRLEVQIQQFINDKGLTARGEDCDIATSCDIYLSTFLDTTTPTARWPGSATFVTFNRIFSVTDTNSFQVERIIRRDFCNVTVTPVATLRVEALDQDTFTPDDIVEQFNCGPLPSIDLASFVTDPDLETDLSWNPLTCTGLLQGGQVQLTVGYRASFVLSAACVVPSPIITAELEKSI